MQHYPHTNPDQFDKEQDLKLQEVLFDYLKHWKWYVLAVFISLAAGLLYLRYTPYKYEASATILVKDDSKGSGVSELSAFEDMGIFAGKSNLDNEIEMFKSRALISLVVKELKLNISYNNESEPIRYRYFSQKPIEVLFIEGDSSIYNTKGSFEVRPLSNEVFELTEKERDHVKKYKFGTEVQTELGKVVITPNFGKESVVHEHIIVTVNPFESTVSSYVRNLNISKVNKDANVIRIGLVGSNQDLSVAFIDNLIKQHGIDAIEDKNLISQKTSEFINERIKYVIAELTDVEGDVESFKTENHLVDVVSEAGIFLDANKENNTRILENEMQIRLSEFVYDYLIEHNEATELIPSNLGLSNPSIERMIDSHNTLVLERNRLLKNSTEKNPVIKNLDVQIFGIHKSLKESLSNLKHSKQIENRELRKTEKIITSKIQSVPKYEREYREIQRQQQIKETLYLYLLQKREETAIALAATVSNTKIIDHAFSNGVPVSPKSRIIYLACFLIALIVPTGIIYLRGLLDTKIHGKEDILKAGLPYGGNIPFTTNQEKIVIQYGKNDGISEAFRLLRTNIDFMLKANPKSKNTVFVTSTIPKEGKSFVSLNLASILALSDKKVLLIGLDLRMPKIADYIGIKETKGVTNFITDAGLALKDIIIKKNTLHNFDILLTGDVPPNPAELLMHPRVQQIFESAQAEYDYIVVDTAPVGVVTDTLLLDQYADATIYIARANFLDKRYLSIPASLMNEKKLSNLIVLMNATENETGYGYGYGYGYSVKKVKRSWWKR